MQEAPEGRAEARTQERVREGRQAKRAARPVKVGPEPTTALAARQGERAAPPAQREEIKTWAARLARPTTRAERLQRAAAAAKRLEPVAKPLCPNVSPTGTATTRAPAPWIRA